MGDSSSSSSTSTTTKKPVTPEPAEGYVPSEKNDFKFKYDSTSGRTAAELNKLFKPPARPVVFPQDKTTAMPLSYPRIGALPPPGLADMLVRKMEEQHAKDVARVERRMERMEQQKEEEEEEEDEQEDEDEEE